MAQSLSLLFADFFLSVHVAALFGLINLVKNFHSFFLPQEKKGGGKSQCDVDAANVFFHILFFLKGDISKALLQCSCLSLVGDIAQLDTVCHFKRWENKLQPNWE